MKLSAVGRFCLFPLFLLLASNVQALYYWDPNGTTAGAGNAPSGTWDTTSSNWSTDDQGVNPGTYPQDSTVAFSAGSDATDPYTVTVSGSVIVRDMHFDDGTATISGDPLNIAHGTNLISVLPDHVGTINCVLQNPGGTTDALHKYKMGTLILGGNNTYSGSTTIEGGTLQLGAANRIPDSSSLILGNGGTDGFTDTPPTFHTGGFNETLGTLQLTGPNPSLPRTIDFGNGASVLTFADCSAIDWGGIQLTLTNFTLGADRLRFGAGSNGLTATQLGLIRFADFANLPGKIDNAGFVTPDLPVFKSAKAASGQIELTWSAVAGRSYRLYSRDNFSAAWAQVGDFPASGNTVTTSDSLASAARFYQVEVLP